MRQSNFKSIIGCLIITIVAFLLLYAFHAYVVSGDNVVYVSMVLNLLILPMVCFLCSIVLGSSFKYVSIVYTILVMFAGVKINQSFGIEINYTILMLHFGASSIVGILFGTYLSNNKKNMMDSGIIDDVGNSQYTDIFVEKTVNLSKKI